MLASLVGEEEKKRREEGGGGREVSLLVSSKGSSTELRAELETMNTVAGPSSSLRESKRRGSEQWDSSRREESELRRERMDEPFSSA